MSMNHKKFTKMNGVDQRNQWFCYMDLLAFTHQEYEKRINEWCNHLISCMMVMNIDVY